MPVGDIFVLALIVSCVVVVASLDILSRRRVRAVASADLDQPTEETASDQSIPDVSRPVRVEGRKRRRP
jgi:hypothetical protein